MTSEVKRLFLPGHWTFGTRASVLAVAAVTAMLGVFLYLRLPILLLPGLLGGCILVLVTLHAPSFGASVVVASQYIPLEIAGVTLVQLAGGTVAVLSLLWLGLTKRGFVVGNVAPPIAAFLLLTLFSFNFTRDTAVTMYFVRKLIIDLVFCLLLVNLISSFDKLRHLLWFIVGMGFLNSTAAFAQVITGQTFGYRAKGLQENENQLGEVAAVAFILPFYLFLRGDRRWKRVAGLVLCAVLFLGLISSISRGALLSFGVGIIFILARERHHWIRVVSVGFLALLVLRALPEHYVDRFRNLGSDVRGTVILFERHGLSSRGYYNKAGMKIWRAHPFLGVGLGNFGYYFVQPEFNPGLQGRRTLPPHNIYVQALAETGIVGLLVLCWWILQAAWNYWVAEKRVEDEGDRSCLRACQTITLVTMVAYFASGNLVYTHLTTVMALSYLCKRSASGRSETAADVSA